MRQQPLCPFKADRSPGRITFHDESPLGPVIQKLYYLRDTLSRVVLHHGPNHGRSGRASLATRARTSGGTGRPIESRSSVGSARSCGAGGSGGSCGSVLAGFSLVSLVTFISLVAFEKTNCDLLFL
jgi:hypothetical protein